MDRVTGCRHSSAPASFLRPHRPTRDERRIGDGSGLDCYFGRRARLQTQVFMQELDSGLCFDQQPPWPSWTWPYLQTPRRCP